MSYEIKTLPSGIIIENVPNDDQKYRWYIKGTHLLHNEGDLAIEYNNGDKCWYQHDKRHRLDGPSIEYLDGSKSKFHHLDGQAIEYGDNKGYRINGQPYSEEEYWKHPAVLAYKYLKEHPELQAFT